MNTPPPPSRNQSLVILHRKFVLGNIDMTKEACFWCIRKCCTIPRNEGFGGNTNTILENLIECYLILKVFIKENQ